MITPFLFLLIKKLIAKVNKCVVTERVIEAELKENR